jgi:hypothetical protein
VHLVSADEGNQTRTYRLDAAALAPGKRTARRTPELDREAHDILGRTVVDLGSRTFQVVGIEPGFGSGGSVLYYDVTVHF